MIKRTYQKTLQVPPFQHAHAHLFLSIDDPRKEAPLVKSSTLIQDKT